MQRLEIMKIIHSFSSVELDKDQAVSHKILQWPFLDFTKTHLEWEEGWKWKDLTSAHEWQHEWNDLTLVKRCKIAEFLQML